MPLGILDFLLWIRYDSVFTWDLLVWMILSKESLGVYLMIEASDYTTSNIYLYWYKTHLKKKWFKLNLQS